MPWSVLYVFEVTVGLLGGQWTASFSRDAFSCLQELLLNCSCRGLTMPSEIHNPMWPSDETITENKLNVNFALCNWRALQYPLNDRSQNEGEDAGPIPRPHEIFACASRDTWQPIHPRPEGGVGGTGSASTSSLGGLLWPQRAPQWAPLRLLRRRGEFVRASGCVGLRATSSTWRLSIGVTGSDVATTRTAYGAANATNW